MLNRWTNRQLFLWNFRHEQDVVLKSGTKGESREDPKHKSSHPWQIENKNHHMRRPEKDEKDNANLADSYVQNGFTKIRFVHIAITKIQQGGRRRNIHLTTALVATPPFENTRPKQAKTRRRCGKHFNVLSARNTRWRAVRIRNSKSQSRLRLHIFLRKGQTS